MFTQIQGKIYSLQDCYFNFLSEEDKEIVEILRCLLSNRKENQKVVTCYKKCKCGKCANLA